MVSCLVVDISKKVNQTKENSFNFKKQTVFNDNEDDQPLINKIKTKTYFDDYLQSDDSSFESDREELLSDISVDDFKNPIE